MESRSARNVNFPSFNRSDIPRILIVDPRNFTDNLLSTDTKSKAVQFFVFLKKLSEKWFTHVLLLAVLILYACLGALIFENIEGSFEAKQNEIIRQLRAPVYNLTDRLVEQSWNERIRYPLPQGDGYNLTLDSRWEAYMTRILWEFENQVRKTCKEGIEMGISSDREVTKWTFMGGLFFSMTVFTTIGYGDNPPKTKAGQAVTMVYAFIGIPLLLMVLADMGKIFTRGIKFVFKFFRRLYYMRSFRKVRRVGRSVGSIGRRATLVPNQYMGTALKAYIPYVQKSNDNTTNDPKPSKQRIIPVILRTNPTPPGTAISMTPPATPIPEDNLEIDDEFNLPITLAIFILMLYLFFGAIIFWTSEKWTLLHAFYFVFISMSTIGFGDFVPTNFKVMLAAFIYLLFGLALTSMCINVVQEKLSSVYEKAKMSIGESIGLDVQQMMEQELSAEQKDVSRGSSAEKSSKESSVEKSLKKNKKNLKFEDESDDRESVKNANETEVKSIGN